MVIDLLLFLEIVFAPMILGVVLWALGNPAKRFRHISRFRLSTLLIAMVPLGIVFGLFRLAEQMQTGSRSIFLMMLSRLLPLVLIFGWLLYNLVDEFRHQASMRRKFPEDLPEGLFDGQQVPPPAVEQDRAATREFQTTVRRGIRKRFGAMLERMSAFMNIQKRY